MDNTIHGILQARVPEWVAFPFCRGSSQPGAGEQLNEYSSLGQWLQRAHIAHYWHLVALGQKCSHHGLTQLALSCPSLQPHGLQHAQASLAFTVSWSSLKLKSIESVMPSNHLTLCRPLLPSIFPSIRVFYFTNESALRIRWPKYWTFSFRISPSNEYSGLISFSIDWFYFLAVQGILRVFSSTTVQKHQFLGSQPSLYASLVARRLKHLPAMRETWVRSLGQKDPLEKEMATHSSILAWRILWT